MTSVDEKKLKVLLVAYPFAPAGRDTVGGAEQILSCLDRSLGGAGHEVAVVAAAGSRTTGILYPVKIPEGMLTGRLKERVYLQYRKSILHAMESFRPDLIHMHGIDFLEYLPGPGVPVLVSLHLPPSWYPGPVFHLERPSTFLHCVSRTQHASCPPGALNLRPPVLNGIPVEDYRVSLSRERFALCLGRICPEKNFHEALDAGLLSDFPVFLGGQVFPHKEHEAYYRTEIVPRLDDRRIFLGPVGFERKRDLLSRARCLLVPSRVPETSSLAAMEALASGTPVVAYRSGALPEIVDDGVTGFLVSNAEEMARAIPETSRLDPLDCRKAALERFSAARMVGEYLDLYRTISGRSRGDSGVGDGSAAWSGGE